jgi:outer membrane protein OmpA-like peptidoglycan-associated protein
VAKRLIELGVAADMLTSKGYGQDRPVTDNSTEEGRAQKRRMEFIMMK